MDGIKHFNSIRFVTNIAGDGWRTFTPIFKTAPLSEDIKFLDSALLKHLETMGSVEMHYPLFNVYYMYFSVPDLQSLSLLQLPAKELNGSFAIDFSGVRISLPLL